VPSFWERVARWSTRSVTIYRAFRSRSLLTCSHSVRHSSHRCRQSHTRKDRCRAWSKTRLRRVREDQGRGLRESAREVQIDPETEQLAS
jgi:hypothetical protein